ncbi:1,2-epoxyphenylacetyl-CoA isomerase [Methylibium sp. T29]|nr:1,2-epoxyphenylacetyl-CoA isomerase [Methylibium sp. T29]EWS57990.1 1,2-epoxyphenylacetyl-CoA isomerase [Methylibium sp. T29-B]
MPTRALVATREAIDAAQTLDFDTALQREQQLQRVHGHANDYLEGVSAFLGKRAPRYTDR